MTLAQIGKLTREHEATVSRALAKTRKALRDDVERRLSSEHGFSTARIAECFENIVDDSGTLDLEDWLGKKSAADRSMSGDPS
jgi:hypothetical protein